MLGIFCWEYYVGNNFHGSIGVDKAQQICRYWDLAVSCFCGKRKTAMLHLFKRCHKMLLVVQGCFDLKEFAKFHF